ncbi:zinc finger protein 420 isoform X2 [Centropristis striata]|uniref:zinc finger protein 420 isoform X2 n=1 Tax=Centropristis striata TaxID=184440 RepID=UPI0027E104BC|nr:zinc finger protein 420 isoform X2 [Centropristis striata]
MDEAAAAAINEDGAGDNGDTGTENNAGTSAEDSADRVFCCGDCGEAFRDEAAYLEHRHQHPQESVYLDGQSDGSHDAEKDNETANFCTICSLSFVETSEFHSHVKNTHGKTSQKESNIPGVSKQHTYECPDCGKCYGVIGHFLNHQRSHRQASKSVFHDLEHLQKKAFQCESCGRNYSRASALDAHRRCHEEKLVKSRTRGSGEAFHTEEPIVEAKPAEHQADDPPEKCFECSCGKAFSAMMRLKTHQRFSRNSQCSKEEKKEKPNKSCSEFYCSECKKTFNGHIALFNHQRWHANHSDDSAKRFPCEECGKVFMTLTFYYRHQRMAHSDETPAKSFLHQVYQLQKKAFECKECGLKFSRASALHSHELHHTDVFRETEKEAQARSSLLPQQKTLESDSKETEQEEVESENEPPVFMVEDSHVNESDEEVESYEPGDFNVQVISASESEDEPVQDLNPDLELLCESDQEAREDGDTGVSSSILVSKQDMDLKIVQIDFEQTEEEVALMAGEAGNPSTEQRFDCPDCYRWFSSASSLRVHRMWHGVRKRRQQTQVKQCHIACKDCGLKFTNLEVFETHLHQHALEEEEEEEEEEEGGDEGAHTGDNMKLEADLDSIDDGENGDEDGYDMSSSLQNAAASMKKQPGSFYTCSVCGKVYTYLTSFQKHQQLHDNPPAPTEDLSVENLHKYQCPHCGLSFIREARLRGHMRVHRSLKSRLLQCDHCNKEFRSINKWMKHVRLHRAKPFWCLSCALGFKNEELLDKHLQKHNLRENICNICHESFHTPRELKIHRSTHSRAKPYQCTFCGMSFYHRRSLMSHRKKHLRVNAGKPLGTKNCVLIAKKRLIQKKLLLAGVKEESEMDTNMEELHGNEEHFDIYEIEKPLEECDDYEESEESDCGEPLHHFKVSKFDPPDEPVEPHLGQELDQSDSEETNINTEHKYWEWECIECDMGFDEMEKLHMHYIKHATGELPMPQENYVED